MRAAARFWLTDPLVFRGILKDRAKHSGIAGVLCAFTLVALWPLLHAGFINFDDPLFISENPRIAAGLGWKSLAWAFSANFFHYTPTAEYWEPLVLITRLTDTSLHGMNPAGHHLTSLLLHMVNAVLLYAAIFLLTGQRWPAFAVAALFAVHPLNVEPVAWLAARKDLVCGTFVLLTLIAYAVYVKRQSRGSYQLLIATYGLAAMTKPMAVSVPLLLLLLDDYPLERAESWRKRILEKAPLFAISIPVVLLALHSQKSWGAIQPVELAPPFQRLMNAVINYALYLRQMTWPARLSIVYPADKTADPMEFLGSAAVLAIVSICAIKMRKRRPCLLAGWMWFLVSLAPVAGFVPIGGSRISDRYMYLPMIGILFAVVWLLKAAKRNARILTALAAAVLAVLVCLSRAQSRVWENSAAVFTHAQRFYPDSLMINLQLALGLEDQQRYQEAIETYGRVLRIDGTDARAWFGIGRCLHRLGRPGEAIRCTRKATALDPKLTLAFVELGTAQAETGNLDGALQSFDHAIQLYPLLPETYFRKTILCARMRRWPEAVASSVELMKLQPANAGWVLLAARTLHAAGDDAAARSVLKTHAGVLAGDPKIAPQAEQLEQELSAAVK